MGVVGNWIIPKYRAGDRMIFPRDSEIFGTQ